MRLLAIVALVGFLVAPACADWDHPIQWDQMEGVDDYGAHSTVDNDTPMTSTTADDFVATQTGPITGIHFAGWSTWGPDYIAGFSIKFWSDVSATPNDDSHPGNVLHQYDELTPYDGSFFGWRDLGDGTFRINLPEANWFMQEEGTVYWISIQGIMVDDGYEDSFYWNFRDRNLEPQGDVAAFESEYLGYAPWYNWGWPTSDPGAGPSAYDGTFPVGWWKSADMAFQLSGIPEPAALLLLGLGFLAIRRR